MHWNASMCAYAKWKIGKNYKVILMFTYVEGIPKRRRLIPIEPIWNEVFY